jgi:hypothetical protein
MNRAGACRIRFIAATLLVAMSAAAFAALAAQRDVPVIVGEQEDLDACGSWAEVSGLNPKGDGFLAVRGGPGTDHALRDRLREGDGFFVCGMSSDGTSRNGAWMAIVYPRAGQTADACEVSGTVPKAHAYRGPCASGWVNAAWVRILAG